MAETTQTPTTSGRQRRPGRRWYLVAGAVALAGVLAGLGLVAATATPLSGALPAFQSRTDPEGTMTVDLRGGQTYVVYVHGFAGLHLDQRCAGSGQDGGSLRITTLEGNSFTFLREGDVWEAHYTVRASRDDRYRITCDAEPVTRESLADGYALGEDFPRGGLVGDLYGALGIAFLLSLVGVVTGGVIARVTAVRRRRRPGAAVPQRAGAPLDRMH